MWLALRSIKSINVDFLNQIRYFSIKVIIIIIIIIVIIIIIIIIIPNSTLKFLINKHHKLSHETNNSTRSTRLKIYKQSLDRLW